MSRKKSSRPRSELGNGVLTSDFGSGLHKSKSHPTITSLKMDEQLKHLKPSKELLYYRRKMARVSKEYQEMHCCIERLKNSCDRDQQLQQEIQRRQYEITQLQEVVSDLQVYLYQEREQVLRLFAENDRLKIRSLEDRKKIQFLLSLTSEKDVGHTSGDGRRPLNQPKQPLNTVKSKTDSGRGVPTSSDEKCNDKCNEEPNMDVLILQNKALASQLEEQTRLFQDHFQSLIRDRDLHRKETASQHEQNQEQIASLSSRLKDTQSRLCDAVKQMLEVKEKHCKEELIWAAERDLFVQSMQQSSSSTYCTVSGGGCSEKKSCHVCKSDLESVKDELVERERAVAMYQEQCILLEEEVANMRQQEEVFKKASKERTQKLLELVNVLKTKYSDLDRRRRLEAEGFRSDVRLMRSRLREVERSLLRLARGTASLTVQNIEKDLYLTVADTVNKAQLLGEELRNIHKKVLEMDPIHCEG